MKIIFMILFSSFLFSCYVDSSNWEKLEIDNYNTVCYRVIDMKTFNPDTCFVYYEYIKTYEGSCIIDSENLIVRQIVNSDLCE